MDHQRIIVGIDVRDVNHERLRHAGEAVFASD